MAYKDDDTGLIEPKFIKLYIEDLSMLKKLSKTEMNVLLGIFTKASYENQIVLSDDLRKYLMEYANTSKGNLSNVFTVLVKKDILKRVTNGVYIINPDIAFRGKQGNRGKLIIEYFNDNRERVYMEIENDEQWKKLCIFNRVWL